MQPPGTGEAFVRAANRRVIARDFHQYHRTDYIPRAFGRPGRTIRRGDGRVDNDHIGIQILRQPKSTPPAFQPFLYPAVSDPPFDKQAVRSAQYRQPAGLVFSIIILAELLADSPQLTNV